MEYFSSMHLEMIARLVIAMLLGMALGLERLYARKNAGMRTYALVTLGAALFVLISDVAAQGSLGISTDHLRIASQVVVGVGFLGGGLIIFKDEKVSNLTTAAGLWVAAAIGVAIGLGLYIEGLVGTLLALFVLGVLAVVERKFKEHMAESSDVTPVRRQRKPRTKPTAQSTFERRGM